MKSFWLASAIALAVGAVAQTETILPSRQFTVQPGPVLDTTRLNPQVNTAPNPVPIRPENPYIFTGTNDAPNGMPVGGLLDAPRGRPGALFPAIDYTSGFPPDPDLAVGPNHVVGVVNSSIAFFTKNGTRTFLQPSTTFFNGLGAGNFQFDPKVFFDRLNNRYVIVFLELTGEVSKLLMAVSDDADPNGNWFRYRVEAGMTINGSTYWLDYPGFGYNKDYYAVSGNMFPNSSGGFGGVQFILMPVGPMTSGGTINAVSVHYPQGFTAQIAENWDASSPFLYAVSRNGNSSLRTYAINTAANNTLQTTTLSVPSFTPPQVNVQSTNGRFLDSLDGRMFVSHLRGDRMVTCHNVQDGANIAARWYEINMNGFPNGTPSLVQSGNVSSSAINYHMPAINMNQFGDISMILSASSSTVTADIVSASRYQNDPAGTMGVPVVLDRSTGSSYGFGRWGDYFGVDVDPTDDMTFWGIGMKVRADNAWSTSIFSWTVSAAGLSNFTIAPSPLAYGINGTGTVTLRQAEANPVVVSLSASPLAVNIPATVTIPAGELTATFPITARQVSDTVRVAITADAGTLGRRTTSVLVTSVAVREPLEIWQGRVAGGNTVTGVVYLTNPAPAGGASVYLTTTNENLATPERNWIVVPAGATYSTFRIRTFPVSSQTTVFVKATRSGVTVQNDIILLPPGLSSLATSTATIKGGTSLTGTVTLNGPAASGGATVTLRSSNTLFARVPLTVTVPAGSRTGTFTITTSAVSSNQNVNITATRLGVVRTAGITVTP